MAERHFKFFTAEWFAGTRGLKAADVGIYISLFAVTLKCGELLDEDGLVSKAIGCQRREWRSSRARLLACRLIENRDGRLGLTILDKMRLRQGREPIPASVRREVFERDGRACVYCGCVSGPFHLDHVHPSHLGGPSTADNLVVACAPCNLSKGGLTLEEWCA